MDRSFLAFFKGKVFQVVQSLLSAFGLFVLVGCASVGGEVVPEGGEGYLERAQTQESGPLRVTTAVPSAKEAEALFGTQLYRRDVQPVWVQVENNSSSAVNFLPVGLEAMYYTPTESAYLDDSEQLPFIEIGRARPFYNNHKGLVAVPSGETRSGFVFTSLDEGTKAFNVDLVSADDRHYPFTFFVPVPGLQIDHQEVDWEGLYAQDEWLDFNDPGQLIKWLEATPCCTTDASGEDAGDPLNIVVIGDPDEVYYAFLGAGWDETETIYGGSLIKTVSSFFSGDAYRYSPVSGLYAFGRTQDVAFQKIRSNIHERNHLRLWLSPARYDGEPVFVGQISRDIGVRFAARTITTHEIDPDVDETREFLLENLAYSQRLKGIAYVGGVGAASMNAPRYNLTGSRYFTDGHRAVFWVTSTPTSIADIKIYEWRDPNGS